MLRRLRCRIFGHPLYTDPVPGEVCICLRCGVPFWWVSDSWRPIPETLTWEIAP